MKLLCLTLTAVLCALLPHLSSSASSGSVKEQLETVAANLQGSEQGLGSVKEQLETVAANLQGSEQGLTRGPQGNSSSLQPQGSEQGYGQRCVSCKWGYQGSTKFGDERCDTPFNPTLKATETCGSGQRCLKEIKTTTNNYIYAVIRECFTNCVTRSGFIYIDGRKVDVYQYCCDGDMCNNDGRESSADRGSVYTTSTIAMSLSTLLFTFF